MARSGILITNSKPIYPNSSITVVWELESNMTIYKFTYSYILSVFRYTYCHGYRIERYWIAYTCKICCTRASFVSSPL